MTKQKVIIFLASNQCFLVDKFSFCKGVNEYIMKENRISAQLGTIYITFHFDENDNLIEMF